MKKIKLLMPILGISALSSALLPLVSCGCKTVDAISFSGETTKNVIVDKTCTGTVIFEGFELKDKYDLNNLKVEATNVSKIASEKLELTILPNNDTEFKVQVVSSDLTKAGTTTFKLKFNDPTSNWTQTLDKQFSVGFNADNDEKIKDDGVTFRAYTDLQADPAYTNNLLITGNYTTNRSIDGLKAEAIVETNTDVKLIVQIIDPTPSNDDTSFQVNIFASNIANNETINFDLKFTDINNPLWETISKGYSISYLRNNIWDGHENAQACIIDNGTPYFCSDLVSSKICCNGNDSIETDNPNPKTYSRDTFNLPIYLNPKKTDFNTISAYFLSSCTAFDEPIIIPNSIASVGENFMEYCIAFNQTLILLNSLTNVNVGGNFMLMCTNFNQQLTLPNGLTSIGSGFLEDCSSFNQPLTLPSGLTNIGGYFMSMCTNFNQQLTLPNGLTSVGEYFMDSCSSFDQPIIIPNSVTSIGSAFLCNCTAFDQPLSLPNNLTSISEKFLENCNAFNKSLILPNTLTSIDSEFLCYCYAFNQTISLPDSLETIGDSFMSSCTDFNQLVTLPNSLTTVGTGFMAACFNMTSQIDLKDLQADTFVQNDWTLATTDVTHPIFDVGVKITGTHKEAFKTRFPNRTNESPYRKLILV